MTPGLSNVRGPVPHATSKNGEATRVMSAAAVASRCGCIMVSPSPARVVEVPCLQEEEHRLCQAAAHGTQPEMCRSRACLAAARSRWPLDAASGIRSWRVGITGREPGDPSGGRGLQIVELAADAGD